MLKRSETNKSYYLRISAHCPVHNKEHEVTGFTAKPEWVDGLRTDLIQIFKEDYPDCPIKPKAEKVRRV
jgi:hypothetical protein